MTALTASHAVVRTTGFERALLTAAAGIDRFVTARAARRAADETPVSARVAAADVSADALAMGSVGMLPR